MSTELSLAFYAGGLESLALIVAWWSSRPPSGNANERPRPTRRQIGMFLVGATLIVIGATVMRGWYVGVFDWGLTIPSVIFVACLLIGGSLMFVFS